MDPVLGWVGRVAVEVVGEVSVGGMVPEEGCVGTEGTDDPGTDEEPGGNVPGVVVGTEGSVPGTVTGTEGWVVGGTVVGTVVGTGG